MTFVLIGITLVYLYLILRFVFGFDAVKTFQFEQLDAKTKFSIIIPFRNEEQQLPYLLSSLEAIVYPSELFEIIIVNDESTDNSVKIISTFSDSARLNLKLINNIRLTNSPKKDAIVSAIEKAQYSWIITTDADCTFSNNWLKTLDAFIQNETPKMVVGPVAYQAKPGFLNSFQVLDFLSLMGATIGGFGIQKPFLCNGANLAYKKSLFNDVNGFSGNSDIASGDDIFLMEKVVKKYPNSVHYIKHQDAIVKTQPEVTFSQVLSQRKRWAAKTSAYTNSYGKRVGAIVLLMNFVLLSAVFLSFFGVVTFKNCGYIFLVKFCVDLWLIYKAVQFFNNQKHLKYYLFSSLLYPLFNVYVALTSWFGGYKWKGRTFSK